MSEKRWVQGLGDMGSPQTVWQQACDRHPQELQTRCTFRWTKAPMSEGPKTPRAKLMFVNILLSCFFIPSAKWGHYTRSQLMLLFSCFRYRCSVQTKFSASIAVSFQLLVLVGPQERRFSYSLELNSAGSGFTMRASIAFTEYDLGTSY